MKPFFNCVTPTRVLLAVLIPFSTPLLAQTPPDAGSLLRDTESTLPSLDKAPDTIPALPPALADTGVTVVLTKIDVSGYDGMSTQAEISEITNQYIGKDLGFNSLNRIADLITAHLKSKGFFLAYAYLPKQEIDQGVLKIKVLPGRLDGAIQLNLEQGDGSEVDISEEQVSDVLKSKVADSEGSLLHAKKIEEAVLTINDFAGIAASMNLEKGSVLGSTKVQLDLLETPRYTGLAWVDNYGSYYTSKNRANALANINNLSGRGDLLGAMVSLTENQRYLRVNYTSPIHASGLKLNLAATRLDYELGEELRANDLDGDSTVYSVGATYPVFRSRLENLFVDTRIDYKLMNDFAGGTSIRDREFTNLNVGLRGDSRLFKGGYTSYGINATVGSLDRSGVESDLLSDKQTFDTDGSFTKLNIDLSRLQRLNTEWTVYASLKSQFAFGNLDSAEKFSLTGPAAIRAYASGESAGDQGWFATLEARYDVPNFNFYGTSLQLQAFLDTGRVKLSKDGYDNYTPSNTDQTNDYSLTGIGFGAVLRKSREYEFSAMYAKQISADVDERTTTGLDSEQGTDEYRFWLQAKVWL